MFQFALNSTRRALSAPIQLALRSTQRFYVSAPKRFYKNAGVLSCDGKYEITLDNKKLKTPSGSVFQVTNEPLAIAIAAEWDSQKEVIDRSKMHLTTLCNTAADNPNKLMKQDIVNYMLNYIPTDTILYHSPDIEDLYKLQCAEWDPIIEWFNERYDADIAKSCDITQPKISSKTRMNISKHLLSYNDATMHGFLYAVDTLKSIILTLACVDKRISVEKAVELSRLEEEYQLKFWGRVEWAHDLGQQDTQARLAASILFIHFHSNEHIIKQKIPAE
ncbi:ATP synthase mitochondrial F1 complex assembly factor 2 [Contarinia nasturtii]|uniref:ATP synthase mitochondrial F1 complex assembly factor 2 n=1 Tax=Contarinia nasturtii TaxID=265458 RepID=UPI0012D41D2E|nr:ATP synthase mitochondrial F1 complex assembly factor 2 [Contarinia nasturtii]